MEIKALHFDLKSMNPTAEYALILIDEFAELGINAIVLEFEDKFPFTATAGTHHHCCWSKEEFRAFAARCREKNIELIPLLQSVGHLDYLLKHSRFHDLRDGGPQGTSYQWCLAREESFALWSAMVDELLETFPDTSIFHIGADECRMDVHCERCGSATFDRYIERVARCCRYIQDKDIKVILWDDVFRKYGVEKISLLPPGVVPCIWMYSKLDEDYIDRMAASGLELWGASRIQNNKFFHALSPHRPVMWNVDAWGRVLQKYPQFTGHIGTVWGRSQCQSPLKSVLPPAMFMVAYLAETLTHGVIQDKSGFITGFGEKFFGIKLDYNTMINCFCEEPDFVAPLAFELKENALRHRDIAEIWYTFNLIDKLMVYIHSCFSFHDCMLNSYREGTVSGEIIAKRLKGVERCQKETLRTLAELKPVMMKYFPEKMWDEFVNQRFAAKLEQNQQWKAVLEDAALKWQDHLRKR